jgi:tRNA threonylcarbamoyladenosine biosynthesis protein TsaB
MILVIESSADYPSVCLTDEQGNLLWSETVFVKQSHSEQLPLLVEKAFLKLRGESGELRGESGELRAVAVNEGPGSYTGLRIGVSLAKGICYTLGCKLLSINGLVAMSEWAIDQGYLGEGSVCAMLDARRDEVYIAILDSKGIVIKEVEALVLSEGCLDGLIDLNATVFIGNSGEKAQRLLSAPGAKIIAGPEAHMFAKSAARKFRNGEFEDVAYFEPHYLKEFIAGISQKFSV